MGSSSQQNQHHFEQQGEQEQEQFLPQDQDQMEGLLHPMDEQDESEAEEDLSNNNSDGYIDVDLAPLATNFNCPICLDVLRQTRTVTECIHRFCKECIEKAMRKGELGCPVCHVHLPSMRSLRADHRYDQIIEILYGNITDTRKENALQEITHEDKDQNAQEILIVVALMKLDEALPGLEQEYLSVSPTYPVELLQKNVASQLGVEVKQVQLLHVRQPYFPNSGGTPVYDQSRGSLRMLESDETVGELITTGSNGEALVLGYMLKGLKQ